MTDTQPPVYVHPGTGEQIPRPPYSSPEHVPVWHQFSDAPAGTHAEIVEHISHWIINPGPTGYLNQTEPLDRNGIRIGSHNADGCFACGQPLGSGGNPGHSMYRQVGPRIFLRCSDDPDHQEDNR